MNREERRLTRRIYTTAGDLLGAKGYAETYLARRLFIAALNDLDRWAADSVVSQLSPAHSSPGVSGAPNPDLPRNRGKVAAVDGLTTVGEEAPR